MANPFGKKTVIIIVCPFLRNQEGMKVDEVGQYCYFYNGWPKLIQSIKEINFCNILKRVEYDSIEWTSRRWGVFTFPEEESGKEI